MIPVVLAYLHDQWVPTVICVRSAASFARGFSTDRPTALLIDYGQRGRPDDITPSDRDLVTSSRVTFRAVRFRSS